MPDDMNDDFEVDTTELDLPADAVEDTDAATDDDGFDFDGLTQAEIDAINSDDEADEDADDGGQDADDAPTESDADDGNADGDDTTGEQDLQAEAASIAERRADIDTQYGELDDKLDDLGKKYDSGEIEEGAYNSQRIKLEREMRRLEASESEVSSKEQAITSQQQSAQEADQQAFVDAATSFMARPENSVFIEGSPEFIALDQQISAVAATMPDNTPYSEIIDKARTVVAAYMTLPDIAAQAKPIKPEDKVMPSISGMPSAVANSTEGGKFAHIDKLSGQDYEAAIDSMTEEQQRAYLHG